MKKTKICCMCKIEKPILQFSKCCSHKDGFASNCKDCASAYRKKWAKENAAYLKYKKREYNINNRERINNTKRKTRAKKGYLGRRQETIARYINHKEQCDAYRKEYQKKNKKGCSARYIVANAIRSGRIIRPENCTKCGKIAKIRAHHDDYNRPLDIVWLCESCHKLLHIEEARYEEILQVAKRIC